MQQIFEIAFAVIMSIGGAGIFLVGLSSWLGKIWANRILGKEKLEHQKVIEEYKSKLETELSKVYTRNENATYITKAQFDKEFEIYINIWNKLNMCAKYVLMFNLTIPTVLSSNGDKTKTTEIYEKMLFNYISADKDFTEAIENNMPFYEKEFFDCFMSLKNKCSQASQYFLQNNVDDLKNLQAQIKDDKNMIAESINKYLKNLRIID